VVTVASTHCPTPEKKPYRSKQAARRGIKTMHRNRATGGLGRLHAYLCSCRAHWHVGHTTY
jgi:hypothetical protein